MTYQSLFYGGFLLITLLLAFRAGTRIRSEADFHVAGRSMTWPVLVGSFVASNVSIGFFLGATDQAARIGYTFWCAYFTTALGFVFGIGVIGVLVRRFAEHHKVLSFGDLIAARYPSRERWLRSLVGVLLSVIYLPYMAAQFSGLAAITSSVLGLPFQLVLVLSLIFVVFYTLWGGMIGVVWTDSFLFAVLLLGMVLAAPVSISHLSSSGIDAWQQLTAQLPETIFQGTHAEWPWAALLGQMVWIFAFAAEPHLLTRFLTARSERTILKALPVCVGLTLLLYGSSVPVGLIGRLIQPELGDGEYYYIVLAQSTLGPLIGGFALAGIAAAALSTCSTEMMITSQALSRDLYHRYLRPQAGDRELVLAGRLAVVVMGLLTLLLVAVENVGIFWLVFASVSLLVSSFFVPVVLGLLWPGGSGTAAALSMPAGLAATAAAYLGNTYLGWGLASLEVFFGLAASLIVYLLASRWKPPTEEERRAASSLYGGSERSWASNRQGEGLKGEVGSG